MTLPNVVRSAATPSSPNADDPTAELEVYLPEGVVLDKSMVSQFDPDAKHNQEVLDEDDAFLGMAAAEVWEYEIADGRETEATRSRYVRRKPVPFPPEPLRSAVVQLTRNRLAAADARDGRRGLWLSALDRLGLGFDS